MKPIFSASHESFISLSLSSPIYFCLVDEVFAAVSDDDDDNEPGCVALHFPAKAPDAKEEEEVDSVSLYVVQVFSPNLKLGGSSKG